MNRTCMGLGKKQHNDSYLGMIFAPTGTLTFLCLQTFLVVITRSGVAADNQCVDPRDAAKHPMMRRILLPYSCQNKESSSPNPTHIVCSAEAEKQTQGETRGKP